jgi:hypothetical protein
LENKCFWVKKPIDLIFQLPLWWLEFELANNTSSTIVENILFAYIYFQKILSSTPFKKKIVGPGARAWVSRPLGLGFSFLVLFFN